MNKTDIVREYRTKYPDWPNLKLARVIYDKEPALFSGVQQVRNIVMRIEGKSSGGQGIKVTHKREARPYNPYNLPDSHQEDRSPFILPEACNNILVISDLHIPYHDIDAVTIALDYGRANKVNTILINGDLIDNYQLSRFEKDPRKRSVRDEFDATRAFLVTLRNTFKNASIYWLKGNHCIRWEKFLIQKVREIWDDPYFKLEERLGLNDLRVTLLDDKRIVKAGKLSITHGHHIMKGFFSPVNSARGVYMKAKQSTIIGHVHKVSTHSETNMDGKVVTTWSAGSLCELKPDYSPMVSNYQHGFAHVIVEKGGDFHVKNYQIIEGKLF